MNLASTDPALRTPAPTAVRSLPFTPTHPTRAPSPDSLDVPDDARRDTAHKGVPAFSVDASRLQIPEAQTVVGLSREAVLECSDGRTSSDPDAATHSKPATLIAHTSVLAEEPVEAVKQVRQAAATEVERRMTRIDHVLDDRRN